MALLNAAVTEFAREGYGGARVDRISKAAKSNDRMLYYYFQSKEKLFNQVIEHCYERLVASEEALVLDLSQPRTALADLVAFNWAYYWEHRNCSVSWPRRTCLKAGISKTRFAALLRPLSLLCSNAF